MLLQIQHLGGDQLMADQISQLKTMSLVWNTPQDISVKIWDQSPPVNSLKPSDAYMRQ